jgi:hypothetical protein
MPTVQFNQRAAEHRQYYKFLTDQHFIFHFLALGVFFSGTEAVLALVVGKHSFTHSEARSMLSLCDGMTKNMMARI